MKWQVLKAFAFALFCNLPLLAQDDCPREKAVGVPAAEKWGPSVSCAGLTWAVGGLSLSTTSGCPLYVTITPAHEKAEPTDKRTKVMMVGRDDIKTFFFACRTTWLLFIPIGSTCVYTNESKVGSVLRLVTTGCSDDEA